MQKLLSQINDQIINGDYNNLSDLHWLFTGVKEVLVINKNETNINDAYYEAYEYGKWINVDTRGYKDAAVVMLIQEPSVAQVTHQLLGALSANPENFVTYSGTHNVGSIRSTVARLKKEYDLDVCAYMRLGALHLGIKTRNLDTVEELLNVMPFDVLTHIPLNLHSTTARLRAFLHNYGVKHGCKFKTRVEGKNLALIKLRVEEKEFNPREVILEVIKQLPYDTPTSMNYDLLPMVPHDKVHSMLRHHSNGTVTIKGYKLIKNSAILLRNQGQRVLYVYGEELYRTEGYNLSKFDKLVINNILKRYDRVLVGDKIEKIETPAVEFPPLPTPPAL